jgi:hypothetical protein
MHCQMFFPYIDKNNIISIMSLHITIQLSLSALKFVLDLQETETVNLCEHLGSSPSFGGSRVVHLFSFLCCVFLVFFGSELCLVYPMLPVSVDCLLLNTTFRFL